MYHVSTIIKHKTIIKIPDAPLKAHRRTILPSSGSLCPLVLLYPSCALSRGGLGCFLHHYPCLMKLRGRGQGGKASSASRTLKGLWQMTKTCEMLPNQAFSLHSFVFRPTAQLRQGRNKPGRLRSRAMLQELSHMDRITQLQDEIQQVLSNPFFCFVYST